MPTVLLVHCDGTNGSTTFTDVSPSAHGLAAQNATVETAQVKFGSGAAVCSINSARIVTNLPGSADFDFLSAPFTIEGWGYATSAGQTMALVAQFNNISASGWYFGAISGNLAFWYCNPAGTVVQFGSAVALPTGGWHFYTADRDAGGTLRIYVDGVVAASTSAPTFQSSAATVMTNIGNSNMGSHGWVGYIDEVRITNGAALYAGAFTPPTGPFTNGGGSGSQARAMLLA